VIWKERDSSAAFVRSGGRPVMSTPSIRMRPACGRNACMGGPVNRFLQLKSLFPLGFSFLAKVQSFLPSGAEARSVANQIVRVSLYPVEPHGSQP